MSYRYNTLLSVRACDRSSRAFLHLFRNIHRAAPIMLGLLAVSGMLQAQGTWVSAGFQGQELGQFMVDAQGNMLVASGTGVSRSTDNGTTWNETALKANVNTLDINQNGLAMATYFDINQVSDVIARSTDWGITWKTTARQGYAKALRMDRDGAPVIVDNTEASRSTDNGATWRTLGTEGFIEAFFDFRNLTIGPDNQLVLGNGGITGGLVFMSTNGGNSWHQIHDALSDMRVVEMAPSGTLFITAVGYFVRSSNQGQTWKNVTGVTGVVTSMMFHDNTIYVTTPTAIYRSTDDGVSWSPVPRTGMPTDAYVVTLAVAANGNLMAATSDGMYRLDASASVDDANTGASQLSIYPQPVRGQATIQLPSPVRSKLRVEALDLLGRSVNVIAESAAPGTRSITLNTEGLAAGIYLVRVELDGAVETRRIVVAR